MFETICTPLLHSSSSNTLLTSGSLYEEHMIYMGTTSKVTDNMPGLCHLSLYAYSIFIINNNISLSLPKRFGSPLILPINALTQLRKKLGIYKILPNYNFLTHGYSNLNMDAS